MNSFNKTKAAIFPMQAMVLQDIPFSLINTRENLHPSKSNPSIPFNAGGGALVVEKVYVSEYGPLPASLLAYTRNS